MTVSGVISKSSKTYANALYAAASEGNIQERVLSELEEVSSLVVKSEDLRNVMHNPSFSADIKHQIMDAMFKTSVDPVVLNFLKVLCDKNRLSELSSIKEEYNALYEEGIGRKNVEIYSSVELQDDMKSKITDALKNKFNADICVDWNVDETLIAGLVFKFDDCVIDTSVKTKLEKLSKNLLR